MHRFQQRSRGEVTKFVKLPGGPQHEGLMEGKRPEMIGILDAARFSKWSADSGRGKEPRLCPFSVALINPLLQLGAHC